MIISICSHTLRKFLSISRLENRKISLGVILWVWSLFALSVLAALGHLSQGERQGMPARYTKGRGKMFSRVRLHFGHSLRSATSPKGRGKMFSRVLLPFRHSLRSATSPKGRGKMFSRLLHPFRHSLCSATSPKGRGKGCPRGTPKGVQKRALCRFGKSDIIRPIPHPGTM